MKKLFALILILVLTFSLAACGSEPAPAPAPTDGGSEPAPAPTDGGSEKKIRVAAVPQYPPEEWAQTVLNGIRAACAYYGYEVNDFDCNGETDLQNNILQDCIVQGYDAIILQACDGTSQGAIVKEAQDAGIIVVDFDCLIMQADGTSNANASVKNNDTQGGADGLETLVKACGEDATILYVQENPGIGSGVYRNNGLRAAAEKYPNLKLLTSRPSEGGRASYQAWVQDWILSNPEIKGVFTYFGDAAIGCYYGCQEAGRQDIKICGYDATAEQVDIMKKDGKDCNLIASVALYPGVMGGVCVEALHEILENGYEKATPDEIVWMENGMLTPDNADTFVDSIWSEPVTDWSKFGK